MRKTIVELHKCKPSTVTFECVSWREAVREEQISPRDGDEDGAKYVRAAGWYEDGEADMLSAAIQQYGGVDVLLVEKNVGNRRQVAIFRPRASLVSVPSE